MPAEKLVVDASVAIKWYVPEEGSAHAVSVLGQGQVLLAPDLLVAELGNALWKKVRRGELGVSDAAEILDGFVSSCPVTLRASSLFAQGAFEIAVSLQQTVYDSLYLAVAVAEGCRLVTADVRLGSALRGTVLEQVVRPLVSS